MQAAVYEFLLRDLAVRPLITGETELDPDEPAVPVTGLAFLCQQFILLLRQRALDAEDPAIAIEDATMKLCSRVRSSDDKTVLRRLYDVINVLEAIDLLERSPTLKRGVQWKGPALTEVHLPSNCPRVEPTRFKDLLRKQPVRKRAAAELLAVQEGRLTKSMRGEGGAKPRRRSAHAARGAVFARLEDPMRRALHKGVEEIELLLSWQPPKVYVLIHEVYGCVGRKAHPLRHGAGCDALVRMVAALINISPLTRQKLRSWSAATRQQVEPGAEPLTDDAMIEAMAARAKVLKSAPDRAAANGAAAASAAAPAARRPAARTRDTTRAPAAFRPRGPTARRSRGRQL